MIPHLAPIEGVGLDPPAIKLGKMLSHNEGDQALPGNTNSLGFQAIGLGKIPIRIRFRLRDAFAAGNAKDDL